jgi:hypothetical protein
MTTISTHDDPITGLQTRGPGDIPRDMTRCIKDEETSVIPQVVGMGKSAEGLPFRVRGRGKFLHVLVPGVGFVGKGGEVERVWVCGVARLSEFYGAGAKEGGCLGKIVGEWV